MIGKYLSVATLCCLALISRAQYDSSYKTTYYEQKVTQFRLIPDTEDGEIIFLGDSITDIAEWADLFKNSNVKNRGISSDVTFGVLARLDEVTNRKPSKIFIMIGINDIAKKTPDSIIVSNYQKIVSRIQQASPATKIYIESILPTNNGFTEFQRHQNKDEHITGINAALKTLANETHCVYIDLYHLLVNKEGKLDEKYTNDGLHLKGEGYMVWKNELITKKYCCQVK